MSEEPVEMLKGNAVGLDRAAAFLRAGRLVAFPTETVYGLGADATDGHAVAAIFAAKGRPSFNPLIVHVPDIEAARACVMLDDLALRLAETFWPGPLTLVLPARPDAGISSLVGAGLSTLAIRIPSSSLARDLLVRAGRPVAAPSANLSGRVSATEAAHVAEGLGDRVAAIVDGGPCGVGLESTILAPGPNGVHLLRPGGLPVEDIERCLHAPLLPPTATAPDRPQAPGALGSHYAPRGSVRLDVRVARPNETMLGFGPVECDLNLSPTEDLVEAAARLFGHLHALDRMGATAIAVSPIPDRGLGRAINDRLRRAAAPRP